MRNQNPIENGPPARAEAEILRPADGSRPRVLVVDDDRVSRHYFRSALERSGCDVTAAAGAREAQRACSSPGLFDCALIDYRMPEIDGIELLHWLSGLDPDLATVVVTAEGEKELVEQALSGGATGFLDKPATVEGLRREVSHALEISRRRRELARIARDMKQVGRTQRAMVESPSGRALQGVRLSFYPCHDAGGDFLIRFRISDAQTLVLAADVSGHDIQAAFVGAYFQGLVRGMLDRSAPLPEILEAFNQILLEEWNGGGAEAPDSRGPSSIALSALLIDAGERTLAASVNGNPLPVLVDRDGYLRRIGEARAPLGWFLGPAVRSDVCSWTPGSTVRVWTDGIESLADRFFVDPLAIVYRLRSAGDRPEWLRQAPDDILAVSVCLEPCECSSPFEPLLFETHAREQIHHIDAWQQRWTNSLRFALPDLAPECEFDILLGSREALLNALDHGCAPGESATLGIAIDSDRNLLRLIVSDPGPGHDFDVDANRGPTGLSYEHRGLEILGQIARELTLRRRGAEVVADFSLKWLSGEPSRA